MNSFKLKLKVEIYTHYGTDMFIRNKSAYECS